MEAQHSIQLTCNFQNFQEGEHGVQSSGKLCSVEKEKSRIYYNLHLRNTKLSINMYLSTSDITIAVLLEMESDPNGKMAHLTRVAFPVLVRFTKWTCKHLRLQVSIKTARK